MSIRTGGLYQLEHTLWGLVDLVYPPHCAGCGKVATQWCPQCSAGVNPIPEPICEKCGDPIPFGHMLCKDCARETPAFSTLRSVTTFDGPARKALLRLKYGGDIGLGFALAWELARFADKLALKPDLVAPIPLGASRLRQRGYNQAASLARPLSMLMGWKYAPACIWRNRETRSQVGLGVWERRENVRDAFAANPEIVAGKTVLLVDDTTTTGSTLDFASWSIIKAGANKVDCIAFAKAQVHQDQPI